MKFIYFDLLEEIDFCNSGPVYCMGLYIPIIERVRVLEAMSQSQEPVGATLPATQSCLLVERHAELGSKGHDLCNQFHNYPRNAWGESKLHQSESLLVRHLILRYSGFSPTPCTRIDNA